MTHQRGFEIVDGILYIDGRQYAVPESDANASHIIHRHFGNIDARQYGDMMALLTTGYRERGPGLSAVRTPEEATELLQTERGRTDRELSRVPGGSRLARYIQRDGRRYGRPRN